MKEKEYIEYIQKLIINAEQEAMKEKLQTNDEIIHLKADGVLALCKLLRHVIYFMYYLQTPGGKAVGRRLCKWDTI